MHVRLVKAGMQALQGRTHQTTHTSLLSLTLSLFFPDFVHVSLSLSHFPLSLSPHSAFLLFGDGSLKKDSEAISCVCLQAHHGNKAGMFKMCITSTDCCRSGLIERSTRIGFQWDCLTVSCS